MNVRERKKEAHYPPVIVKVVYIVIGIVCFEYLFAIKSASAYEQPLVEHTLNCVSVVRGALDRRVCILCVFLCHFIN